MWRPSITSDEVIIHSQGPWDKHKYVKIVDGKYYYPNSYKDGRTISNLRENAAKTANREQEKGEKRTKQEQIKKETKEVKEEKKPEPKFIEEERKAKEEAEKKKAEEAAEKEKNKKSETDSDSKDKKKKGSGSSSKSKKDKDKESDEEKKKKKSSKKKGSSKKSSSGKSSKSDSSKSSNSSGSSYLEKILKERREKQRQREKERRRRLNKAMGREYLNHSAIWSPTPSSDELWHHGIEGQKWGKRNGPPYPLDQGQKSQAERKYRTDGGHRQDHSQPKRNKKVSEMSNRELQKRVNRKQLEQQYKDLSDKEVQRGKNKVLGYIRDYGTVAGAILTTAKLLKLAHIVV